MKVKLTDTGIRSYQPRAAHYAIGDAACPGLCLRITPKAVKTFAFAYRNKGTARSLGSRSAATRTCRWPKRARSRTTPARPSRVEARR